MFGNLQLWNLQSIGNLNAPCAQHSVTLVCDFKWPSISLRSCCYSVYIFNCLFFIFFYFLHLFCSTDPELWKELPKVVSLSAENMIWWGPRFQFYHKSNRKSERETEKVTEVCISLLKRPPAYAVFWMLVYLFSLQGFWLAQPTIFPCTTNFNF